MISMGKLVVLFRVAAVAVTAATLLFLARALLELDEFDAAIDATKRSAEAGDSSDRENANNYERFVTDTQRIHNTLADRRQVAIDFYESYPALN